jgi:hypothetical protein
LIYRRFAGFGSRIGLAILKTRAAKGKDFPGYPPLNLRP